MAGLVDADFWAQKATVTDLLPYVSEARRTWMRLDSPTPAEQLPESQYFVPGERLRAAAASDDPRGLARACLDDCGITRAILNPGAASSVSGFGSAVIGSELARAVNEWTAEAWLPADERLRGSIVVAPRAPARAADEIRRAGTDARFAQVLLAYPQQLLGNRMLAPILEAACELDLPVNLQAGGAYSGSNAGITMIGDPASILEAFVQWEFAAQPHLLSAILHGVFDRFPELRLVLSGFGVAWIPSLLWRLDHEIRTGRVQPVKPLPGLPSEIVRERVRFTTSPLELPAEPHRLAALLDLFDGHELLLHGSGATGETDPEALLDALDVGHRELVAGGNAAAWFPALRAS
jgi:predicted TIM-barrel fold metal-dependent hydrolase